MKFLPFHDISTASPCAVVDARHPEASATLSHWRGAEVPDALRADTSTEIVLHAIAQEHSSLSLPFVSNNHFDIDGCMGIWALMNPALAMEYREVLVQAAQIGDFREYLPKHPASDLALKLVCWVNALEQRKFYRPFGRKEEAVTCLPKYDYFLPRIAAFLSDPEAERAVWQAEYDAVLSGLHLIQTQGQTTYLEDIRLWIVEAPEPVHYYALFSGSQTADLVLMMYSNHRYELEYKYTGWIDTAERQEYPRLPFEPLAMKLNALEGGSQHWWGNSIMDTGPALRLGQESLTKEQRFAHPTERQISSSSISPERLKTEVIQFYRKHLAPISPQTRWTWQQMREAAATSGLT